MQHRVRGLATIATPHRGTPLATWILDTSGLVQTLLRPWAKKALTDLTPEVCQHFNEHLPDQSDVRYISYAGVRPLSEMPPWFRPWTRLISKQTGENESQAPLSSAMWAEFKGVVRADHLELVGWNRRTDHTSNDVRSPFIFISRSLQSC
jgi:triacylglycerol lipase